MEGPEDSLGSCLVQWVRSFDGAGKAETLVNLTDGLALWTILHEVDANYFSGALPEPDVNSSSDWTRKWQNIKHVERQVAIYYRDVCNGLEDVNADAVPNLKAIAASSSVQELEKLIMVIIRAAMASPESNQKMAQRLMGLGRENAMIIASHLRQMVDSESGESQPVSRDESAYKSEQEMPGETKQSNGTSHRGVLYQDPSLEREEELLRAQATIDKLQASQAAAQLQLQELRQDKERLQEAFDVYRSEIDAKGRKSGGDDAFKKLQRQADNDKAYIEDLESRLQSSRSKMDNYERQLQRQKDESEAGQQLRDEMQMLKADNEDLHQKIKANENLKKKIQTLQEQEKANVQLREEVKQANDKLEDLDRLKQLQASLEKEIIEKKGLIRNQEYQINELTTTRKHAEYDARVLAQKLSEARERHDRDHSAIEELREKLRDSSLDDATITQEEEANAEEDMTATPNPGRKSEIPKDDETKHLSEKLTMLEQQLEAADARLKQASERNAALEEKQQSLDTDSEARQNMQQQVKEREATIAALRKELEAAPKQKPDGPTLPHDVASLQRENHLMATAWYDMATRLQNNGVSLGRRRQEPKSWIGKQRALVGPGSGLNPYTSTRRRTRPPNSLQYSRTANSALEHYKMDTLPKELYMALVDFIPRPSDLQALCLTNKALREVAMPRLYKAVELVDGGPEHPLEGGVGFFRPNHPGHPYVRRLTIDSSQDKCESLQYFVRLALQLLPRDSLEAISIWKIPLDEITFTLLCTQHSALQQIELGRFEFGPSPILKSSLCSDDWLSKLNEIDIPGRLGSLTDLAGYQYMIRHAPKLSSLMLRGTYLVHEKGETVSQDFDEDGYLLTTSLLSRLRGDQTRRLNLVDLLLDSLNFESANDTLAEVIDFAQLRRLDLFRCIGSEQLLSHIASNFRSGTSNLTVVVTDFDEVNPQILEGFLRSWTGLNTLRITTGSAPTSFDCGCLSGHVKTLEPLAISLGAPTGRASDGVLVSSSLPAFLSKECTALYQLGVALPSIEVLHKSSDEMGSFGRAIESLLGISELEVLRIYTWPEPGDKFFAGFENKGLQEHYYREAYLERLDKFTSQLMNFMERQVERSKIPMICFGDQEWTAIYSGEEPFALSPTCYVPAVQTGICNSTRTIAIRTSLSEAKYLDRDAHFILN
ncbi:hypothetical protein LTR37_013101 [Vermiconidia calcicola]|uniref:Uncharacterized protein n=1 Tax=Vermiconidia calcicola TaxID=1690605 RepID=A0ACC3MY14_9PEZI|nr:hypothetical protein LTR37_013101 [Vermiconidia calcicola]